MVPGSPLRAPGGSLPSHSQPSVATSICKGAGGCGQFAQQEKTGSMNFPQGAGREANAGRGRQPYRCGHGARSRRALGDREGYASEFSHRGPWAPGISPPSAEGHGKAEPEPPPGKAPRLRGALQEAES